MFDIPFHMNLFIYLVELEHLLKTLYKRTQLGLFIYLFNSSRLSIKSIK